MVLSLERSEMAAILPVMNMGWQRIYHNVCDPCNDHQSGRTVWIGLDNGMPGSNI